jgi:hypothetical protein
MKSTMTYFGKLSEETEETTKNLNQDILFPSEIKTGYHTDMKQK